MLFATTGNTQTILRCHMATVAGLAFLLTFQMNTTPAFAQEPGIQILSFSERGTFKHQCSNDDFCTSQGKGHTRFAIQFALNVLDELSNYPLFFEFSLGGSRWSTLVKRPNQTLSSKGWFEWEGYPVRNTRQSSRFRLDRGTVTFAFNKPLLTKRHFITDTGPLTTSADFHSTVSRYQDGDVFPILDQILVTSGTLEYTGTVQRKHNKDGAWVASKSIFQLLD